MTAIQHSEIEDRARRAFSVMGTAVFFLLVPATVAGWAPWWIPHWRVHAPFPGFTLLRIAGTLLIVAGIPVLLESFARFALQGIGTPSPTFPTQRLVVHGFYRFVRNPMYVAVLSVILGQAMLLGSRGVLIYAAIVWPLVHLFVMVYEEPTLRRSFGAEYATYRAHVPRWIPRFRPWRGNVQ